MDSLTKKQLTAEEINRIAQAAFNCTCKTYEELSEGWANSAYQLTLEDGREVVLKVAADSEEGRMRCERGLMRTETEVMRRLEQLGSVPLPHIYVYDDSRKLLSSEYFLMERVKGETYDKVRSECSPAEREAIDRELGSYFRRIHQIEGEGFGYYLPNSSNASSWEEAFIALMRDVMKDGQEAGVQLPMAYEDLDAELERRRSVLGEVKTPRLVHWDSWPGNVFVQDGRVESIIDFERALWADPLMEHGFGKFWESDAFAQGYAAEDAAMQGQKEVSASTSSTPTASTVLPEGSEESQQIRRALYALYLDLVMRVECHYRGFGQEHTEWAQQNLADGWNRYLQV
ncbi:hypothetical protein B9G55_09540 [Saccharibacillus sp. O16]|nr:hypothetical protein B9G55_09540 [Saccharibacillus sp. O16]